MADLTEIVIMTQPWRIIVISILFQMKASYVCCDAIETYFGGSGTCYKYSANIVSYPSRNYNDALSYCKGQSHDVVVIETQEENDIIDNLLFVTEGLEFWLGLTNHSGDWFLEDNSTAPFLDITNTVGDPTGTCVVSAPDSNYGDGKMWKKSMCSAGRDTVCEILCNDTLTTEGTTGPIETTPTTAATTSSTTTPTTTAAPTTTTTQSTTTTSSTVTTTSSTPATSRQTTPSQRWTQGVSSEDLPPSLTTQKLPLLANFSFYPMEEISWNVWLPWSSCTVSCGGGVQVRWRLCSSNSYLCDRRIEPDNAVTPTSSTNLQCVSGYSLEGQECASGACPTFGFWFAWGSWSDCSASCGVGTRRRARTCLKPAIDSTDCNGRNISHERCNMADCQDTYSPIVREPPDGGVAYKESDRRASAQAVGTVGIVFMVVTVVMFLICDVFQVKPSTASQGKRTSPSKK